MTFYKHSPIRLFTYFCTNVNELKIFSKYQTLNQKSKLLTNFSKKNIIYIVQVIYIYILYRVGQKKKKKRN